MTAKEDKDKCSSIMIKILSLLTQASSKKKMDHFIQLNMFINILFEKLKSEHFFFFILIVDQLSAIKEVDSKLD